jgi:hypothetical protein
MVNRFADFTAAAIRAFDLAADVPIIVSLGQLSRSAIGRSPDLRAKLIFLVARPTMAELANLNVQLAKPLINIQVFNFF